MPRNSYNLCWGVKNNSVVALGGCDLKKKIANLTCSNGLPRQEKLFQKLFTLQNGKFCFTGNSQLSHLFRLATPISSGLRFLVCDNRNQNQQTEMLKKGVNSTTEKRKWASATLVWSLNPLDKLCVVHSFKRTPPPPPSLTYFHSKSAKIPENLFAMYH